MRLQKNSLGRMTRNRVMDSDPLLSYLHVIPMGTGEVYMECDSGPPVSMTCLINQQDRQLPLLNDIDTIDDTRTSRGRVGVVKLHEYRYGSSISP